jgi:hypothetical protein
MVCALVLLAISASALMAQRVRNRPAAPTPPPNDLKIKYRTTTAGQSMESTTMLKGARERSELKLGYGRDIINITQCDLKRTVQISDSARKYVITPMASEDSTGNSGADAAVASAPSTRGGVITYTTSVVDTGERKEMFGFNARHVKTTTSIDSSADACTPMKQRMETDGWYIDFSFGLNCDLNRQQMAGRPYAVGGCRDRVRFNRQGTGKTGYALIETTTSYGPNGQVAYTSTKEVVELSREPLDQALFDVPAGYVETSDTQELYAMPSMDAMTQTASGRQTAEDDQNNMPNAGNANAKQPGSIRIGVIQINNRTDRSVSTESLRERLLSDIQGNGVDAVALNATSPAEAEAEAKAKQCDFILYTDITTLKSSKLGGMFGRVTGASGVGKTEAKVEYKLVAVGESSPRLQSAASAKEEGDEVSAGTAIDQEAKMVSAEAKKKSRS